MADGVKEQPAEGDVLLLLSKDGDVYSHRVVDPAMWQHPWTVAHCMAWLRKSRVMWRRREDEPSPEVGEVIEWWRPGNLVVVQDGKAVQYLQEHPEVVLAIYRKVWSRAED